MTIELRLQRLEKSNRRWKRLFITFALLMPLGLAFGADVAKTKSGLFDKVIAKDIAIVNKEEKTVALLTSTDKGGQLIIYNNAGEAIAVLGLNDGSDNPTFQLHRDGKPSVFLIASKDGGDLMLSSADNKGQVSVGIDSDGDGLIAVADHKGKTVGSIP